MGISLIDLFPLISALFVIGLGIFVFFKNRRSKLNIVFGLITIVVSVWLFGTFMMFLNKDEAEMAIFWDRFIYMGVVFVPALMYHFSLIFSKKTGGRKLLIISYILSVVFLILSQTDHFVSGLFRYSWGVHTQARFFHHIFLVSFFIFLVLTLKNFYFYYQKLGLSGLEKSRAKYVFIAFFILIVIGSTAYVPAYKIGIYPFAYISGLVFTIILAYAILKYRLMDIRVAIKRSTVFTLLVAVITAAYVLAAFLLSWLLFGGSYTLKSQIYVGLIVALLVAIGFRPFYGWLKGITDNFLFKGDYQPQQLIAEISATLSQTLELDKLVAFLEKRIRQALRVEKAKVLILGSDKELTDQQRSIAHYFNSNNKEPLVLEELKRKKAEGSLQIKIHRIVRLLARSNTALVVPLFIQQRLIGLFLLSAKKSGDMFTQEDIRTLETIASQAAIAIENARSYQKIKDFSKTLQQEVDRQTKELKQANVELKKLDKAKSEFISIASHQLRTPVSVIKGICSMMREGDVQKMPKDRQEHFLNSLWQKSVKLENIISDILNATEMASAKYQIKKDQAKLVDLAELIEAVVSDFQERLERREIELKFKKPKDKIRIYAQKEYLKEAISNLIDNAIKYTPSTSKDSEARDQRKEKGRIAIFLTKQDDYAMIQIKDNGIGIPQDEIANLFTKFERASNARDMYTDGSGLGLFIVKEITEGHHGKVWVESELGKGSKFFIQLPIKLSKVDVRKHIMEG